MKSIASASSHLRDEAIAMQRLSSSTQSQCEGERSTDPKTGKEKRITSFKCVTRLKLRFKRHQHSSQQRNAIMARHGSDRA